MAYGPKAQLQFLKLVGIKAPTWLSLVTTMALVIALILLLISALWMYTRQNLDPVAKVYASFCHKLKKAGLERSPTEGPMDSCRRIINVRSDWGDAIAKITAAYIELRYNRFNQSELAHFRKMVASFKATNR